VIGNGVAKTYGQFRLSEAVNIVCEIAETFYKIDGEFANGQACAFAIENNKLVYKGASGRCFLLNGVSDLAVNKACEVAYVMYLNGVAVLSTTTPHTFTAAAKTSNISVTGIVVLNKGDTVETYVKTNDNDITVSVKTLAVTLWS
jgi:hypothetical protein